MIFSITVMMQVELRMRYTTPAVQLMYAEIFNFGSYTDWRLPTEEELQLIVNFGLYNPAIDQTFFPLVQIRLFTGRLLSMLIPTILSRLGASISLMVTPSGTGVRYTTAMYDAFTVDNELTNVYG